MFGAEPFIQIWHSQNAPRALFQRVDGKGTSSNTISFASLHHVYGYQHRRSYGAFVTLLPLFVAESGDTPMSLCTIMHVHSAHQTMCPM